MFDPILDGEILCHNCDDNGCEFCEDLELDLQLDDDDDDGQPSEYDEWQDRMCGEGQYDEY